MVYIGDFGRLSSTGRALEDVLNVASTPFPAGESSAMPSKNEVCWSLNDTDTMPHDQFYSIFLPLNCSF